MSLTLASELDPSTIKTTHIVYIGYLSALGMLMDVTMAESRYSFGGSYDELIDSMTGNAWVSEAGEPHEPAERYRDFAYLASFRGPGGNQHLVIAGTVIPGSCRRRSPLQTSSQVPAGAGCAPVASAWL